MRAKDSLVGLWSIHGVTPEMISRFKPDEVIILKNEYEKSYTYKGKKKTKILKRPIVYPETTKTRQMRKIVEKYNELLERTRIDTDVECITPKDRYALVEKLSRMKYDKKIIIRLADKKVYRVFNNESFEQGGRFYGAWWIGAPSIVRKYITINGEPTKELDYSGIHIHLLYALKGINYAELDEDPYILNDGEPDRELNKKILLTAFNAKNEKDTAKAVYNELRKSGKLGFYNIYGHEKIYKKLKLLKIKHKPIAEHIASNFGKKLQYYDSCIIEKLINHFTSENIPILTIHDSVVCQAKYADFVKDKMWEFYSKTIYDMLDTHIEYNSINPHIKIFNKIFRSLKELAFGKHETYKLIKHIIASSNYNKYKYMPTSSSNIIIKIKDEQRANKCYKKCNHSKRANSSISHKNVIRIQLDEYKESNIYVLNIS